MALQLAAMLTLRKSYTLSLQARAEQHVGRHPAYFAQMVFWFGFALVTRNALVIAVVVLTDLPVSLYRIHVEERLLPGIW